MVFSTMPAFVRSVPVHSMKTSLVSSVICMLHTSTVRLHRMNFWAVHKELYCRLTMDLSREGFFT